MPLFYVTFLTAGRSFGQAIGGGGVADKLDLLKQARAVRHLASRALKRALHMSDLGLRASLRKHAEQLQHQANELERRAASLRDVPIF
jgi:hypothetical protein